MSHNVKMLDMPLALRYSIIDSVGVQVKKWDECKISIEGTMDRGGKADRFDSAGGKSH